MEKVLKAINSHAELAATATKYGIITIEKIDERPIGNELIGDYIDRIIGKRVRARLELIKCDDAASVAHYFCKDK